MESQRCRKRLPATSLLSSVDVHGWRRYVITHPHATFPLLCIGAVSALSAVPRDIPQPLRPPRFSVFSPPPPSRSSAFRQRTEERGTQKNRSHTHSHRRTAHARGWRVSHARAYFNSAAARLSVVRYFSALDEHSEKYFSPIYPCLVVFSDFSLNFFFFSLRRSCVFIRRWARPRGFYGFFSSSLGLNSPRHVVRTATLFTVIPCTSCVFALSTSS